jgi:hypothetical protein
MNATFQHAVSNPRLPLEREMAPSPRNSGRLLRPAPAPADAEHEWLVDLGALVRCREILSSKGAEAAHDDAWQKPGRQSPMAIPPAYDHFCQAHFGAVKRMHPELSWEDVLPAYAIALSAHAVLCVTLDHQVEDSLERHWPELRGDSKLSWPQARTIIADGCSALNRLDPLAMDR